MNNIFTFAFSAAIDPAAFAQAFHHVVAASDALRTIICEKNGVPFQEVLPTSPAALQHLDFSLEPDPEQAAAVWIDARAQTPLDISVALYDAALLQLSPDRNIWYLNQHHLITDAISIFLVYEHTLASYTELANGRCPTLSLQPFANHLQAKIKFRQSRRYERAIAFWQEHLAGGVPPLRFYGRHAPAIPSIRVKRHTLTLSPTSAEALHQKAEAIAAEATAPDLAHFNALAALTFALLHTITGQRRLGLVTTIHNRPTPAARQIIGVVMELVPLLITIEPGDTFQALTDRVQAAMRHVLIHYRYGAGQALRHNAFEVMLNLNQRPSLYHEGKPVEQVIIHPHCGSERLSLHAHFLEATGAYEFYIDFNEDIFPPALQTHVLKQFQAILDAFLQDSEQPLTAVSLPWPTLQTANDAAPTRPAYAPPQTGLQSRLQAIWEDVLDTQPIGIHDDFFALGGESWQAMSLFLEIEKATGRYLPIATLLQAGTIAHQATVLTGEPTVDKKPDAPEGLIRIQAGMAGQRPLFYIPGAAGNTLIANRLAHHLHPDLPIYACLMPGIHKDESPHTTIEALAAVYRQAIQRAQPHGPYQIVGFSAGGVTAFEVAQQLVQAGEIVDPLISIDISIQGPGFNFWRRLAGAIASLRQLDKTAEEELYLHLRDRIFELNYNWRYRPFGLMLPHLLGRLKRFWYMNRREKWQKLQEQHRRRTTNADPPMRTIPTEDWETVNDSHLRHLGATTDRAMRLYIAEPYPGDMVNIRCSRRHGRATLRSHAHDLGWGRVVRHVETIVVPAAGHLNLVHEPHIRSLGKLIQEKIDGRVVNTNS